jgi:hypothetical protein
VLHAVYSEQVHAGIVFYAHAMLQPEHVQQHDVPCEIWFL